MKHLLLLSLITLMFASCGSSSKGDIDVVGRWYAYTDDSCTEVDSTAYFDFNKDQSYQRRYHNAGSLEVGGYAITGKTKRNYGDCPSVRVNMKSGAGEVYYVDIVEEKESDMQKVMFCITYRINDKEDIVYYTKDKKYQPQS